MRKFVPQEEINLTQNLNVKICPPKGNIEQIDSKLWDLTISFPFRDDINHRENGISTWTANPSNIIENAKMHYEETKTKNYLLRVYSQCWQKPKTGCNWVNSKKVLEICL